MPAQILVVDDLLLSRMILRAKLSAACYETQMAATGAEALHLVSVQVPDLVLLDCNLPDATGLEVCRLLRSKPATSSVPIILFSADQSRAMRLLALETGADDFLSKPLDDAYLMSRIRALLRNSAVEKDYQAGSTPGLRHGMAEAASRFQPAARVTLVRSPEILARSAGCPPQDIAPDLYTATCSIRLDQAVFLTQIRSALTSAFAVSISLRMMATIATLAGFPASRSAEYLALRSGLKRMATRAGM